MSVCEKKLINSVDGCVRDTLLGLVALNPTLHLLQDHNVVLRADLKEVKSAGKVILLSGGGSGHDPSLTGFVGKGMLSGAIAGQVFAAPSPASILAAIRVACQSNSAGTLLIVMNYTGDRLNFGLAFEKARREKLNVDLVIIGEDCAKTMNGRQTGRRALAGTIMVMKVAGQMSEEGRTLQEIAAGCLNASKNMGTIGLSLSPCALPGSGCCYTLKDDEMELGLGAHGEAGVNRLKIQPAKQAVETMLNHMTDENNQVRLPLEKGDHVALLMNNMGGLSVMELNIISGNAIELLENRGIHVDRAYAGSFVTSFNMAGVSISILHLDENITRCLDAPTNASGWHASYLPDGATNRVTPELIRSHDDDEGCRGDMQTAAISVDAETEAVIRKAMQFACTAVSNCSVQLNAFDSTSGDGDAGDTLKRGAHTLMEALPDLPLSQPHRLFLSISSVLDSMGGTSGALYSIFFNAAAVSLADDVSVTGWINALTAGTAAIMSYGGACPGDRTLIDALYSGQQAAESSIRQQASPLQVFAAATEAAENAAIATTKMAAFAGRASYVDPALLTDPDPGAHAVGILMRAAYEAAKLG